MSARLVSRRALRLVATGMAIVAVGLPIVVIAARTAATPSLKPPAPAADGTLRPRMLVVPKTDAFKYRFALSETEITQGQYRAIMGKNPSSNTDCGDACPVERVSWIDAANYCNTLSAREGLKSCYGIDRDDATWIDSTNCDGYRLPSEIEWQTAALAGTTMQWSGTDDESKLCDFAVVNAEPCKAKSTEPVHKKKSNPWFLCDMTGNVWEWVWDCWDPSDVHDTPDRGKCAVFRVIRGGSFNASPQDARVAVRVLSEPSARASDVGFRVARSLPSSVLPSDPLPAPNQ